MRTDCKECFHYGFSPVTGRVECAIRCQVAVCEGECIEFVRWKA